MPISLSTSLRDPAWDAFLQSTPLGQFQQSSMWAQVKQVEGWSPIRAILHEDEDGEITGGFQILQKKTRFGRIGYVSKGPILAQESDEGWHHILGLLTQTTRQHGLRALVLQLPDFSHCPDTLYPQHRFLPNNHMGIVQTTLMVDTSKGFNVAQQRMSASVRKNVRQAQRRGLAIKVADHQDLGVFFELMRCTCVRQSASPNPASLEVLESYWNALYPSGNLRVFLAEFNGSILAGQLCIPFGNRVSLWKKGWNSEQSGLHPNEMLHTDVFAWACANDMLFCDFCALSPHVAAILKDHGTTDGLQMNGTDTFNLRFGGRPFFLPVSQIFLSSMIARLGFRFLGSRISRIMRFN